MHAPTLKHSIELNNKDTEIHKLFQNRQKKDLSEIHGIQSLKQGLEIQVPFQNQGSKQQSQEYILNMSKQKTIESAN